MRVKETANASRYASSFLSIGSMCDVTFSPKARRAPPKQ